MITAAQMRAARALLGIDQRTLAALSGLSLPTVQRMEASRRRGARQRRLADEARRRATGRRHRADRRGAASTGGGRGVRLINRSIGSAGRTDRPHDTTSMIIVLLPALARCSRSPWRRCRSRATPAGRPVIYGGALAVTAPRHADRASRRSAPLRPELVLPFGLPWIGAHFRLDALAGVLPARGRSRRRRRQPLSRSATAGTRRQPHRVLPFYPAFLGAHEPGRAGGRRLQLPARRGS